MGIIGAISTVKTVIQVASSTMFIAADLAEFGNNVVRGVKAGWAGEDLDQEIAEHNEATSEYAEQKPSDVVRAAYKISRFARNITTEFQELFQRHKETGNGQDPIQLRFEFDNIVPFEQHGSS